MKTLKQLPKLCLSLLLGLALFSSQALTAQSANQGTLTIIDIEGDVSLVNNTSGAAVTASEGTSFPQGHTIRTGSNSSVILILSNGATLFIGANSSVNIETFGQTIPAESSDQSNRPLNELEREIGISDLSIQILGGTIYLDTQPMNDGSSIVVRDDNVVTRPAVNGGSYAQYFQRERARSIVEVVQGNVSTQGSNEMAAMVRDTGIYHFENGQYVDSPSSPFDESIMTVALLGRIGLAQQFTASGAAPSPTSTEGDINNIKDANDRVFVNPVTGGEVFTPGNPGTPPSDDVISIIE